MDENKPEALWVRSMYGAHTRKGLVELQVGSEHRILTPDEARALAANLVGGAAAAEADEYLMHFATNRMGVSQPLAADMLMDFRAYKARNEGT
jgi:hypothetical protein